MPALSPRIYVATFFGYIFIRKRIALWVPVVKAYCFYLLVLIMLVYLLFALSNVHSPRSWFGLRGKTQAGPANLADPPMLPKQDVAKPVSFIPFEYHFDGATDNPTLRFWVSQLQNAQRYANALDYSEIDPDNYASLFPSYVSPINVGSSFANLLESRCMEAEVEGFTPCSQTPYDPMSLEVIKSFIRTNPGSEGHVLPNVLELNFDAADRTSILPWLIHELSLNGSDNTHVVSVKPEPDPTSWLDDMREFMMSLESPSIRWDGLSGFGKACEQLDRLVLPLELIFMNLAPDGFADATTVKCIRQLFGAWTDPIRPTLIVATTTKASLPAMMAVKELVDAEWPFLVFDDPLRASATVVWAAVA
ncbi:uncharacterized protein BJ171DRAFT_497690 [Polychytrium aggregatum]|uniref:uncharacterized protein n=1 Tax=Polychytrium aggregatum TaxID=110093 RepID=UPI0022FDD9DB|nr:uncharacterized protein BJ171DRAFT_497690 [Polychytrium aggregatum]KAI9206417.1 hypothetical protein BJ171DRAFT_497690 [Polychytrium aggregatum]